MSTAIQRLIIFLTTTFVLSCGDDLVGDGGLDAGPDAQQDSATDADNTPQDGATDGDIDGAVPDADGPVDAGQDGDPDSSTGPVDIALQAQSGTRLRVQWYESEEGDRVFGGFYDTLLEIECDFNTASDGTLRCLPRLLTTVPAVEPRYADAECTDRLGTRRAHCDTPRYMVEVVQTCPNHLIVYEPRALHTGIHYYWSGSTCHNAGVHEGQQYRVGPSVAPSTFAEGAYEQGEPAGGLAPVFVSSADGARQFAFFHDVASGFDCSFRRTSAQAAHCLPNDSAARSSFTDPSCRNPAVKNRSCELPLVALEAEDMCHDIVVPYVVGDRLTQDVYYNEFDGSCNQTTNNDSTMTLYASGPPADHAGYVRAETQQWTGTHRLRRTRIANEHFIVWTRWLDSQRDVECGIGYGSDGTLRCLPRRSNGTARWLYLDEGCTTSPVADFGEPFCAAGTQSFRYFDKTCPGRQVYYAVGDPVESQSLYYNRPTGCDPGTVYDEELRHVGAEIPPSSFVLFQHIRE